MGSTHYAPCMLARISGGICPRPKVSNCSRKNGTHLRLGLCFVLIEYFPLRAAGSTDHRGSRPLMRPPPAQLPPRCLRIVVLYGIEHQEPRPRRPLPLAAVPSAAVGTVGGRGRHSSHAREPPSLLESLLKLRLHNGVQVVGRGRHLHERSGLFLDGVAI